MEGKFDSTKLFSDDEDLKLITENCMPDNDYRETWKIAFKDYIDGNW